MKDLRGFEWTYGYNNSDLLTSITDPRAYTMRYEYDGMGRVTAEVDALNYRTEYAYDYDSAVKEYFTRVTYADGERVERTYDEDGYLVRHSINGTPVNITLISSRQWISTDQRGLVTTRKIDEWDNTLEMQYADGSTTKTEYDYRHHRPKKNYR